MRWPKAVALCLADHQPWYSMATFHSNEPPTLQILGQFFGHPFDAYTPGPARQFPNPLLESKNRFRRDPPLWLSITGEAEAQKLPFPWSRHRTLLLVHLELELRCRSEEHTSELQSLRHLVCRLLLEKKKKTEEYK